MEQTPYISWKTEEYTHREKGSDWYWALGVIALCGAVIAVIFNNLFFALFIVTAGVLLGIYANRKPDVIDVAIYEKGISVRDYFYPYEKLKGFSIDIHPLQTFLLFDSERMVLPIISVPVPNNVELEEIEVFLKEKLPETEIQEPASHKIMDYLGF